MPTLTQPYRVVWRDDNSIVVELRDWSQTEPTHTPLTTCAQFATEAELETFIDTQQLTRETT